MAIRYSIEINQQRVAELSNLEKRSQFQQDLIDRAKEITAKKAEGAESEWIVSKPVEGDPSKVKRQLADVLGGKGSNRKE